MCSDGWMSGWLVVFEAPTMALSTHKVGAKSFSFWLTLYIFERTLSRLIRTGSIETGKEIDNNVAVSRALRPAPTVWPAYTYHSIKVSRLSRH